MANGKTRIKCMILILKLKLMANGMIKLANRKTCMIEGRSDQRIMKLCQVFLRWKLRSREIKR